MGLAEDREFVGRLLDSYGNSAWRFGVALEHPADAGVPVDMQIGDVNSDGWVEWAILASTAKIEDLDALEKEFGIDLPVPFRAYLLARLHLFNQVESRRYKQQILLSDTPSTNPLGPLKFLLNAWRPLLDAGYIPFAEWGDSWGPMCFDARQRSSDGDCPIVWFDHEVLFSNGEDSCRNRDWMAAHARPLYESCREFLVDVFSVGS